MTFSHIKQPFKIFQEKGAVELYRAINRFAQSRCREYGIISQRRLFELNTMVIRARNTLKYKAPPEIFDTIYIDPSNIEYRNKTPSSRFGIGRIRGGDWDENGIEPLDEHPTIQGIRERFKEGKDWEETTYYRNAKEILECEGDHLGYTDLDAFLDGKCTYVDDLYEKLRREGYSPADATPTDDARITEPTTIVERKDDSYKDELEVLIQISRNGEIHLQDGHHRIGIARVLDIDEIPAHVVCRHERWQEIRDDIYRNGLSTEDSVRLRTHPDLQDILH